MVTRFTIIGFSVCIVKRECIIAHHSVFIRIHAWVLLHFHLETGHCLKEMVTPLIRIWRRHTGSQIIVELISTSHWSPQRIRIFDTGIRISLPGSGNILYGSVGPCGTGLLLQEFIILHIKTNFHLSDNVPAFQRRNSSCKSHGIRNAVLRIAHIVQIQSFIPWRKIIKPGNRNFSHHIRLRTSYLMIKNRHIGERAGNQIQRDIVIEVKLQPVIRLDLKFGIHVVFIQRVFYTIQQTTLVSITQTDIISHFVRSTGDT